MYRTSADSPADIPQNHHLTGDYIALVQEEDEWSRE